VAARPKLPWLNLELRALQAPLNQSAILPPVWIIVNSNFDKIEIFLEIFIAAWHEKMPRCCCVSRHRQSSRRWGGGTIDAGFWVCIGRLPVRVIKETGRPHPETRELQFPISLMIRTG
jgi:hypothetical protein